MASWRCGRPQWPAPCALNQRSAGARNRGALTPGAGKWSRAESGGQEGVGQQEATLFFQGVVSFSFAF